MSTIAAISTAMAPAGIGVVRISGSEAINIADLFFKAVDGQKLQDVKGYTAKFGRVFDESKVIDQVIALVFRTPHSYTGENVVEISCHGGTYMVRKVLDLAIKHGARLAQPGEFTKRAFLNGKLDLSEAESVMNLISAQGEKASNLAICGMEGALNKKINIVKKELIDIMAHLSAWADYPEENIPQVSENLLNKNLDEIVTQLINIKSTYSGVVAVTNGIKIAVAGCPNVGKSSLLNLLMGYQRAIVTNVPGTTRDIVEGNTMLGDIPITFMDTAGIRVTDDIVEKIGVEKAVNCLSESDIILVLFDGSRSLSNDDMKVIEMVDKEKSIAIINKCDLKKEIKIDDIKKYFKTVINMSTIQGDGIKDLKEAVYSFVGMDKLNHADAVISCQRQFDIINRAETCLSRAINDLNLGVTLDAITVLIQEALNALAELTGENVGEDIINTVFSKFCLGK